MTRVALDTVAGRGVHAGVKPGTAGAATVDLVPAGTTRAGLATALGVPAAAIALYPSRHAGASKDTVLDVMARATDPRTLAAALQDFAAGLPLAHVDHAGLSFICVVRACFAAASRHHNTANMLM